MARIKGEMRGNMREHGLDRGKRLEKSGLSENPHIKQR